MVGNNLYGGSYNPVVIMKTLSNKIELDVKDRFDDKTHRKMASWWLQYFVKKYETECQEDFRVWLEA